MATKIFSLFNIADSKHNKGKSLLCTSPYSAFIFYRDFKLNLITGEKIAISSSEIFEILAKYRVDKYYKHPIVIHLFYEFGLHCVELVASLPAHKPLAIILEYSKIQWQEKNNVIATGQLQLEVSEYPSFDDYHRKFEKIYQHLIDGDCYQVNLTSPFYFKFKGIKNPLHYVRSLWCRTFATGAFAHATYIDGLGKLFLSNSPECLFLIKKENKDYFAYTMPIKGTLKADGEDEKEAKWQELLRSPKDQAELYMITDLLRNDLTKICLTPATVVAKKLPLFVPGLVHQYSKIRTLIEPQTNMEQIVRALFPGGSITGAPKKRVMQIIAETEKYQRGFYCGSTILLHRHLKTGSINIRSATFDFTQKEMYYGAGGGITLLSQPKLEFDESYAKMESFLRFLKVKNVNKG
jgi:para-aminobenzoate synthetase component I